MSASGQSYKHDDLDRLSLSAFGNGASIGIVYDAAGNIVRVVKEKAGQIGIEPTGVDQNGVKLGGGDIDPHWSIVAGPGLSSPVPAIVLDSPGRYGYVLSDSASWVWVNSAGTGGLQAYTFEIRFNMPAEWVGHAKLSGLWAVDNIGAIYLNDQKSTGIGVELPDLIGDNYQTVHAFELETGLVGGENKLQFVVTDLGNPGGLLVDKLVLKYQASR